MRKLKARVLAIPFVLLAITASFQNCSTGFNYDPSSGALSSASNDLTGVFGLKVYSAGGYAMSNSLPFDTGVSYELRATGSNTGSALLAWSIDPASSTASCITSATGNLLIREIKCTTAGVVKIDLAAYWDDGTVSYVSHTHGVGAAVATPTPVQVDENTVLFTIANGTAGSAWNPTSPILVFVGQNLRVVNNDIVPHRIQTNGSPFPAQTDNITPNGGSKDFAVTSAIAAGNTTTFDGMYGNNARIFIESIDGDAKYASRGGPNIDSCTSCHGNVNSSNKRGTSLSSLKQAIAANRGNMGNITLPEKDLQAIVYALNH